MSLFFRPLPVVLLCCSLLIPLCLRAAVEPGFVPLFEGAPALQWKHCGTQPLTLRQGVVDTVAPPAQGNGILWYAGRKFGDFTLKVEFKRENMGGGCNSGILFRFDDPGTDVQVPYSTGYGIEISTPPNTGILVDFSKPLMPASPEKAEQWNDLELTVVASRVMVRINGQITCDYEASMAPAGHIGLENWEGGPGVQFRNARLREYPAKVPPVIQPRNVEEALLCFAWKMRSVNDTEFAAYFLPDGKLKRARKEGLPLTWTTNGPLEVTLHDGDRTTTLLFTDETFREFSGKGLGGVNPLSGVRTTALIPPSKMLAALAKPDKPRVARFIPEPVPAEPAMDPGSPAESSNPFAGESAATGTDPGVEPGFTPLLDATHNAGWKHGGGGGITLAGGVATTVSKKPEDWGLCWYSGKTFGDFILKLEYRTDTPQSRAGILVRLPDPAKDVPAAARQGLGISLGDGKTGDFISLQLATGVKPKEGEWNDLELTFVGAKCIVSLNGKVVNELDSGKSVAGYIGLQNAQGEGEVHFRKVRVMEFPSKQGQP